MSRYKRRYNQQPRIKDFKPDKIDLQLLVLGDQLQSLAVADLIALDAHNLLSLAQDGKVPIICLIAYGPRKTAGEDGVSGVW